MRQKMQGIMLQVYDNGTCCMREPVEECHTLAVIACSENRTRWHITPRSQADVTLNSHVTSRRRVSMNFLEIITVAN